LAERGCADLVARLREAGLIEQVERLDAQLQPVSGCQSDVLEER
jgi:hypothetical protein